MASLIANSCGAFCCLPCKYQTNKRAAEMMVSHKKTCLAFEFNLEPPNRLHPRVNRQHPLMKAAITPLFQMRPNETGVNL
jgi:hypothetical protein